MKQQIILIHGGNTHKTYEKYLFFLKNQKIDFERYRKAKSDWKKTLGKKLGKKYEVICPDMPNRANAKYAEWKIWFEKFIPHLKSKVVLIGHSLGGIFLAKYLSENKIFRKKIRAVFLVAAPYGSKNSGESLADFVLSRKLNKLSQAEKIFIYHSKDDPVVPFADALKYKKTLPQAKITAFKNRGHFNQANFPELIKEVRKLYG